VAQLAEMASTSPPFDAIIVESSGISEPQQVAEAFDLPTSSTGTGADDDEDDEDDDEDDEDDDDDDAALAEASARLREVAHLDCAVSVVDSRQFPLDILASRDTLADRGQAAGPSDGRSVVELLIQQVEFADVIVMNKADLLPDPARRDTLAALLRTLNPRARLIIATRSAVSPSDVLRCGAFSMEHARSSAGWLQSLAGNALPESVEYGISHVVFRARRPFHPVRLQALLFGSKSGPIRPGETLMVEPYAPGHPFTGIVRSKGGAWVAAEWGATHGLLWAQAGLAWTFEAGGAWAAPLAVLHDMGVKLEPGVAKEVEEARADGSWDPSPDVGDRRTEVVLIGVRMNGPAVLAALNAAVVTDAEWKVYLAAAKIVVARKVAESAERSTEGGISDGEGEGEGEEPPELEAVRTVGWIGAWDFEVENDEEGGDCDDDEEEDDEVEEEDGN
jgi:G3E family GTPase